MVRGKVVNKVMVNWAASFLSVLLLMSMVALPALAAVAANSVNSSSIIDGAVRTRDIKRNAINSSRIRDYSIRKEDIHSGSINKYKLTSNSVNTYKIQDGQVKSADIADGAVNSAKIANGSITNADISGSAAISDSKISYDTNKTGYLSISPGAFSPESDNTDYYRNHMSLTLDSGSYGWFYAPVELPGGAVVTKLRYTAIDNDDGEETAAQMFRVAHSDQTTDQMANAGTFGLGSSPSWRTVSDSNITNPTIDNNLYTYVVRIFFSDPVSLWGGNVVVDYTYKR